MKRHYAAMQAWGSVLNAIFAGLALVIGIGALIVGYFGYRSATDQSELKETADAISEWSNHSPPNAALCLTFIGTLTVSEMTTVVKRLELPLSNENVQIVQACLSDQDTEILEKLLDVKAHKLRPLGVSLIAQRVNTALDADAVIASLIVNGIGKREILASEIGSIICRDDQAPVKTLRQVPNRNHSFQAVQKLIDLPKPLGCAEPRSLSK
jgi:hypothetical protein